METIVKAISNEFMCRARQWRDVADFEQSGINYPLIEHHWFHKFNVISPISEQIHAEF